MEHLPGLKVHSNIFITIQHSRHFFSYPKDCPFIWELYSVKTVIAWDELMELANRFSTASNASLWASDCSFVMLLSLCFVGGGVRQERWRRVW